MLVHDFRRGLLTSMNAPSSRSAVVVTIGIIAALEVAIVIAVLFAGDISERAVSIVTTVLGSLSTVLAGLLLYLRIETVNTKVDTAAEKASVAAVKASVVEQKVEKFHEDVLNGPMRENVKRAISEDRHEKANRDAVTQGRAQLAEKRRRRAEDAPS